MSRGYQNSAAGQANQVSFSKIALGIVSADGKRTKLVCCQHLSSDFHVFSTLLTFQLLRMQ